MEEVWRPVVGYEGLYEVSSWGRVRNCLTGLVLRPGKNRVGYMIVVLWKEGVPKTCSVHRLIGMAFPDMVDWTEDAKGRPFEELEINHKDQNKENNCVENLEWCNRKYNQTYSLAKTVYQCTMDDQLVNVWPSTAECGRHGFYQAAISACCRGKLKKHKGFKWSYLPPNC